MRDDATRLFWFSVAVYAGLWAMLASPWLAGTVTIPYDAKAHFQAQLQFLANALNSGQSPFWAPNVFAGTPQIADPQSLIFSPAFLLAYFNLTSFRAVDAYALGLLGLGGLAVMGLFRDRGWHPAGGIVAALAFAFGASAAWRIQHLGQVQSYALFGITLFLLDRALLRRSLAWGAAAGVAAGAMLVEPDQVALLAGYILAVLVVERWLAPGGLFANVRATLAPLVAAGLAAIAVAGLPLLLTYLFVAASSRPEIAYAEAVRGSLHPASLLTFLVSDLFGAFDPKVDYWGPFSEAWDPNELTLSQNMSQIYIGALPALLVVSLGVVRRHLWAREVRGLTMLALALVIYAIGRHTPAFAALYDALPGVAMFRRPADATFMIGAVTALLAGYVLHRQLSDEARQAPSGWALAGIVPLAALVAAMAIALAAGKLGIAWRAITLSAVWLAAALALLSALPRFSRRHAHLALAAVAAMLGLDLAANNGPNESTALPAAQYKILDPEAPNATIAMLKSLLAEPPGSPRRDRVELTGIGFEWPNASLVHGIDHVLGYNPLRLDVITRGLGAGDTVAGPDQRHFTPLFPSYRCKLADLLGLRYIATSVPVEEIDHKLKPGALSLVARTADAYIYENYSALSRAMLVRDWQLADFDVILRTGQWPADPAATVLLESLPKGSARVHPAALRAPVTPLESRVSMTRYENTRVDVQVETPTPTFLVLNDIWHPWWTARLDGQDVPILKANVMFRAVEVPAGRHTVRFDFRPIAKALEQVAGLRRQPDLEVSLMPMASMASYP